MSFSSDNVETVAVTEAKTGTCSFLWRVENFLGILPSDPVTLDSPVFRGGTSSSCGWQLKTTKKSYYAMERVEYVAIYLYLTDCGDGITSARKKFQVRFQISILDGEGQPACKAGSSTMSPDEFGKGSFRGYDKFILVGNLLNPQRRLLNQNALQIQCQIWITESGLKHTVFRSLPKEQRVNKAKELLADDFGRMLRESLGSDLDICTGRATLKAHKAILAGRSPVFATMLNANMLEEERSRIEIPEFDDEVVKGMLEYLYTGQTGAIATCPTELLQVAEKYQLTELKEDCEFVVADTINIRNAAEILVLSHLSNASLLKSRTIAFISRNKEEVKKTEGFTTLVRDNVDIFVDLYIGE